MHWRKLVEGCEQYRQQVGHAFDPGYERYMRKHRANCLPSPEDFDESHAQDLIGFINAWRTRSPMQAAELAAAYQQVHASLSKLAALRLESAALDQPLGTGGTASDLAEEVFEAIATCGKRYEAVGASKILHALVPHFFVMWDNSIAAGYGCATSGRGYAFAFLPQVRKELEEAMVTYAREHMYWWCTLWPTRKCTSKRAAAALVGLGGDRPLPKLLDEFNYAKHTLSVNELRDRV
jgi:hypothetical protein